MSEITLDWDIKFETYKSSKNWARLEDWFKNNPKSVSCYEVCIRHSASGNTHVKLNYDPLSAPSNLDQFPLRAFLADDPIRLCIDEVRFYKGEPFNRLWDFKEKDGQVIKSGEWELVLRR